MPKEEIVEGLRQAMLKGEPLEKAMMSFYNAGYPKEDIEEAAMYINAPHLPSTQPVKPTEIQQPKLIQPQPQAKIQQQSQSQQSPALTFSIKQPQQPVQTTQPTQPMVIQRVSDYNSASKKSLRVMNLPTIILLILLFFLIGMLVITILFKEEISNFLNNIVD